MKTSIVFKFLGLIIGVITASMAWPFLWSLAVNGDDWPIFLQSMGLGVAGAGALFLAGTRGEPHDMGLREAFACVTLSWVAASAIAAVPFWLYGATPTYVDSYFEAMSGLTTTGATVITEIEALPKGILLWRAMTHWLGGMGIIVLTLTVMPLLGIGSFHLYSAESPGMVHEKLTPRVQQTAMILWGIYVGITLLEILFLRLGGMSAFDAITHAFATVATGGFSTKNSSVAYFDSAYIDAVITFFMFLCGVNFTLMHAALANRSLAGFYRDPEFIFYVVISLGASVVIALALYLGGNYASPGLAFRYSVFQVVSVITTTGFITADYEKWPFVAQALIFLLLFFGPCAGSTGGGIKHIRILVLFRHASRHFMKVISPRSVPAIKLGKVGMEVKVASACLSFFAIYIILFVCGSFVIVTMGDDQLTAMAAVVTCISNVGPGFGTVGPVRNFASQPQLAKCVYSFLMLCGRLEIYTVLVLFTTTFWRSGISPAGARRELNFSRENVKKKKNRREASALPTSAGESCRLPAARGCKK